MKLSVILPAFREGENLYNLLPQINSALNILGTDAEVLVLDTIEPMDDTPRVAAENSARYISRRGGNLYGDAVRTGIEEAKGNYILFMDSDGSHDPTDIVRLFETVEREKAGVVIGSRYIKGGHTDNPVVLRLMSSALNLSYRIIFGLNVKDVSNSLRIYRADELKAIKLECNNFDIVEEILIRLKSRNKTLQIREIPITFGKRQKGESKRDLLKFIISYLKTIRRLLSMQRQEKRNQIDDDTNVCI